MPEISAAQAAARTGIPKRTILHAITTEALPATRAFGDAGPYLIDPDDLAHWAAGREQASA